MCVCFIKKEEWGITNGLINHLHHDHHSIGRTQLHCVCDGLALANEVQPVGWLCAGLEMQNVCSWLPFAPSSIVRTSYAIGRDSIRCRIDGDTNCRGSNCDAQLHLLRFFFGFVGLGSIPVYLAQCRQTEENLLLFSRFARIQKAVRLLAPHTNLVNLPCTWQANVELVIFSFAIVCVDDRRSV